MRSTLTLLATIVCLALARPSAAQNPVGPLEKVQVTAGHSVVLATDFDVTRIAVTNPAIADANVVTPREILIDGKTSGTISLIVWGDGRRVQYELVVQPAVTTLQQQLQMLFPGENINVGVSDEAILLSGSVSSNKVSLRAAEIAAASSSKLRVINLLQLPGGNESQQVLLQVRFAEVNRRATEELGISFFTGINGYKNWVGRTTTQQFAAPFFDTQQGGLTFSDYLNLFVFNTKNNIGAVVKALETRGLLQSLAEPNLIAYNGQKASFLAGGEFPVPIVQGITNAVTIMFKEFGIRLNFTPTIAGDTIRLKVNPEVSSLDFANGIVLSGFRIPSLITRRADTDVELRDGQSFAIAGLLNNLSQEDKQAIPILGSLPIIGNLFKSKAETKERTELMVLITPRLVRPLEPDEVPALPTQMKHFLPSYDNVGENLTGGGGAIDAPARPKQGPEKK
ncbi:MAG TPA: type II and III secretion system protein family protein [Vicinamibacterales bacterium]|nr:type II and III secretion system protein family protein [Vicinamibacterales bacterium]